MSFTPLFTRRRLLVTGGVAAAAGLLKIGMARAVSGPDSYTASWDSVDRHPAAPEWFQDAKFGIYYHWGVFSVPAFADEWYPRKMYIGGDWCNTHHRDTYGDPSVWPYHNFITGAKDKAGRFVQFAPKLKSAGGNFDPEDWAKLFADAGAKFAGPVAEHHDGYSMWDSKVNEWNSVLTGPRLDLLKLHADAIRAQGMKLWVSLHHAFNFNGYYDKVPPQPSASLRKLYGQLDRAAENQLWFDKLKEVIDGYQPDLLWQDFDLHLIDEGQRLKFLAHYYNQAVSWNKDVLATFKDGLNDRGEVYDFERGGPAGIKTPYWLTDESISSSSWCYTEGIRYYSAISLTHSLIDRISKGGSMVLNIAPMADGTIPAGQRTVLLGIGDYLKRYGESVYGTRAWSVFGEGPTTMGGGNFQQPKEGTAKDIRFTRSRNNRVLYATVLGWPGRTLTISTLKADQFRLNSLVSAQLLDSTPGTYLNLTERTQDGAGLHLTMPSANAPFSAPAYVVKLTFSGTIPTAGGGADEPGAAGKPWMKIANVATGLVLDSGGNAAASSSLKQWSDGTSNNLQWQLLDCGKGHCRLLNRTSGLVADSGGDTGDGARVRQTAWTGSKNQQWRLDARGKGRWQLVNRATGTVLSGDGSRSVGAAVTLRRAGSSPDTYWAITTA